MITIFLFSHQMRDESQITSGFFWKLIEWMHLDFDFIMAFKGKGTIRKVAHVTEYYILFVLAFRTIALYRSFRLAWQLALVFCLVYAGLDEFHQVFVPGRSAKVMDIGIDMIGATLALGVVLFLRRKAEPKL